MKEMLFVANFFAVSHEEAPNHRWLITAAALPSNLVSFICHRRRLQVELVHISPCSAISLHLLAG